MYGYRSRYGLSSTVVLLIGLYVVRSFDFASLPMTEAFEAVDKKLQRKSIVDTIVVPDAPPEELAQSLDAVTQEARKAAQTAESDGKGLPASEELTKKLLTGVKTAEKLATHTAATAKQQSTARRKKLTLLYLGAQSDRGMFAQPLYDYVDQLLDEEPSGDLAPLAAAVRLEIRDFATEESADEVLPKLVAHTKTYPGHPTGIELFRLYGEHLEAKPDLAGARQCYERAIALFGATRAGDALRQRLTKVKLAEQQEAVRLRGERLAAEAKQRRIERKLGSYSDGYFVVYVEENVKPTAPGSIYFYRYQYEVFQGKPAAVSYIEDLSDKWTWSLVRRFPEDAQGREKAYDLRKELLKRKGGRTG